MKTQSTRSVILTILLVIGLALVGWLAWSYYQTNVEPAADETVPVQTQDESDDQPPIDDSEPTTTYESDGGMTIVVDRPLSGSLVTSPLTVDGTVPGNWSFEASFPVRLLDADRQEITAAPATLTSDWMTTNQVPFAVQLEFDTPMTSTGYLVLEKDNPSGLAENEDRVEIPVRFE
ncbi:hypothetical protein B7Y94_03490 [Candidatus Saccharibacteria bacterium 32-49-12]|nr:MAG: hypothetical protein B7Y94_03490 [Candidatus Saccharibacteria bacterium 32-49-12]